MNARSLEKRRGGSVLWFVLLAGVAACSAEGTASMGDGAGPEYSNSNPGVVLETGTGGVTEDPSASPQGGQEGVETLLFNPFVETAHDPLSTFAADVDTGSYDVFRSMVGTYDELPDPGSVRVEEFINSFPVADERPADDAEVPLAVTVRGAERLAGRGTSLLRVTLSGRDAPKPKANLVFLIDVSGSMQEEMGTIQTMLLSVLDELDETDRVSIVTYAGITGLALPSTAVSDRQKIEAAIEGLTSGGSTNGAGGIVAAYEQASVGFIEDGANHVVLCTDGDFNVGPSSTEELVDLIVEKRKSGINLTTVGFGYRSNEGMMERVANSGNGIYNYVGSEAEAERYAREDFLSTLVHIAKDVKIQVEFNPEQVYAYRLLGYENRAIADDDFRNDIVDAGEIGARHQVTAIYELALDESRLPTSSKAPPLQTGAAYSGTREADADDLLVVKVRYKQPRATEADPAAEIRVAFAPSDLVPVGDAVDADLEWIVAVATYAEILRGSPFVATTQVESVRRALEARVGSNKRRAEFLELFEKAEGLAAR